MTTLATEDRSPVKLKDIPQVLIDAVLSIEDRKFYEHHGVDWAGTIRALFKNVDAGGIAQGGSTITEQLVKNTFSVNRKRDLTDQGARGGPRDRAREAAHEEPDPRGLPEPRVLRERRVRRRGRGRALLPGHDAGQARPRPVGAARRARPGAGGPRTRSSIPAPPPAGAARCSTRWSRTSKITAPRPPRPRSRCRCRRRSATRTRRRATTTSTRSSNVLLNDDPNVSGRSGRGARRDPAGAADAVYRGGLKIYTTYDPTLQFEAHVGDAPACPPKHAVHRVARRDRQRRRRRARDRERARVRAEPVRPRDRWSRASGRLVVQGDHARGRARPRLLAERHRVDRAA